MRERVMKVYERELCKKIMGDCDYLCTLQKEAYHCNYCV